VNQSSLFHKGSAIVAPSSNGHVPSIIANGGVANGGGGGKHLSNKKSIINDEKIMKVASVYAMGSLSPVLSKHQAVQQQYQKLRDLS